MLPLDDGINKKYFGGANPLSDLILDSIKAVLQARAQTHTHTRAQTGIHTQNNTQKASHYSVCSFLN